nr:BA14K family protein [uncultured Cohaesibacter sp.]
MKLRRTIVASAIALCMGMTGLPLGNVNASLGVVGVSEAQAQPAPRPPRGGPPVRRRSNSDNVGAGVAGAIIGLAVGAIAADAVRKNANRAPEWCNVRACSSRYRSFRASDCTFQPYNGPRKYCRM